MPKKSKRTSKKVTVDKSVKQKQTQNVKQSVVVNVHSKGSGSSGKKRQSPANTKSFNKGMTYLAGTPFRQSMFPVLQHNVLNPQGEAQAAATRQFHADMVNRVTALENARNAQLVDQQEARSMVVPNPTQTPTALKPINMIDVPEELRPATLPSPQVPGSSKGDETVSATPMVPREETPPVPQPPPAEEAGPSTRNNELFEPEEEDDEPFTREAYSLRSAKPDEDFLTNKKDYINMTDEEIIKRYRKAYPNKETAGRTMSSLITSLVRDAIKRSSEIKV